jgi:hypothetical protein
VAEKRRETGSATTRGRLPRCHSRRTPCHVAKQRQCYHTDASPFFEGIKNFLEKKTLCATEQHREDVVRDRIEWKKIQDSFDLTRFVFIDETWTKTNMTPLYGRAEVGKRVIDHVPHGHWKTTTFLAALRHDGMTAPMVVDGAINGELFLA